MNLCDSKPVYDSDLAAIEADMPRRFKWAGKCYIGQAGANLDTLLGQDSGWLQQYDLTLVVRLSVYPTSPGFVPPAAEDALEMEDANNPGQFISHRIKSVTRSPDDVSVVYGLKADS